MTHPKKTNDTEGLFGQTVRTVAILVGACVLFVGILAVTAVAITNKAIGPGSHAEHARHQLEAPNKTPPQSI